jgi:hypothetical protein
MNVSRKLPTAAAALAAATLLAAERPTATSCSA